MVFTLSIYSIKSQECKMTFPPPLPPNEFIPPKTFF